MWAPRTAEEIVKWESAAQKDARFSALLFGVGAWVVVLILVAGGWIASAQGMAAQRFLPDGFWLRVLFLSIIGLPFAIWTFRREKRKHLERAQAATICAMCDTAAEYNEGNTCKCGGTFVLQRTVRWIENSETGS